MLEVQLKNAEHGMRMPDAWEDVPAVQGAFFERLRKAERPLLICDYDGTLAPFQLDKMQAVPYEGVATVLQAILRGRTRLAFVSGRPVDELIALLPLAAQAEVWGMHGREHRTPDGSRRVLKPSQAQLSALDVAEATLREQGFADLVERKIASVALHWRTIDAEAEPEKLRAVRMAGEAAFASHTGKQALGVLPFDGGVELRAEDHTKGHATEALLTASEGTKDGNDPRETPEATISVFLGDDTTDEDAFQAVRARGGLGMLVRNPPRPSHAQYSLAPPAQLLEFLRAWEDATAGAARGRKTGPDSYTGEGEDRRI
jgi:trehalose-phosphatase